MGLDFRRAAELFMASEDELAQALGIEVGDLRSYRQNPDKVPEAVLQRLGSVLVERGRGMARVGELLQE